MQTYKYNFFETLKLKSSKINSEIIKNEKFIPKFRSVPACVNQWYIL